MKRKCDMLMHALPSGNGLKRGCVSAVPRCLLAQVACATLNADGLFALNLC